MKLKTRLGAGVAATVMAVTVAAATAGPAQAITRVSCTSSAYTWIFSNQTTCWANAGSRSVALYSTSGLSAGNNAGFVRFSSGSTRTFGKYDQYTWAYTTVNYITIY